MKVFAGTGSLHSKLNHNQSIHRDDRNVIYAQSEILSPFFDEIFIQGVPCIFYLLSSQILFVVLPEASPTVDKSRISLRKF